MQVKNRYRFVFTSSVIVSGFPSVEFSVDTEPLGEGNLTLAYDQDDDWKYDYKLKLSGEITFRGNEYLLLMQKDLQQSTNCGSLSVSIDKFCNGSWVSFLGGKVKLFSVKWDLDNCTARFPIEVNNKWECDDKYKETAVNLYLYADPFFGGSGGQTARFTYGTTTVTMDNGIKLQDILKALFRVYRGFFDLNSCVFNIKSDFFQINPDTPDANNYVTGLPSTTNDIIVFQKSDVKRWNALNNATKLEVQQEEFAQALAAMFNVRFAITYEPPAGVGSAPVATLRVEHISWFVRNLGLDFTQAPYKKFLAGKRKYSYAKEKVPSREVFKFMEANGTDFIGVPIVYDEGCYVNEYSKEKTWEAKNITTDIAFCVDNPDAESDKVADKGMCIVSCTPAPGLGTNWHTVQSQSPILGSTTLPNNVFSWAHLHRDFHRHNRPVKYGVLNNVQTVFISTVPKRKGETFEVPMCPCDVTFEPMDKMKTFLGTGILDSAKFSFKDDFMSIDLLYEEIHSDFPVTAVSDSYTTIKNVPYTANTSNGLLYNDVNPDLDLMEVISNTEPQHGEVTVNADGTFTYTPDLDYIGADFFTYTVRDAAGSTSSATVFISVLDTGSGSVIIAGDEHIFTRKNVGWENITQTGTALADNPPFFFVTSAWFTANDTGTFPPLFAGAVGSTTAGGTVYIGGLGYSIYIPPPNFTGIDSCTMSITDANGNTSTSTFTIYVTDKFAYKLVESNVTVETLTQDCSGSGGSSAAPWREITRADYKLELYMNDFSFGFGLVPYTECCRGGASANDLVFNWLESKTDFVPGGSGGLTSFEHKPLWDFYHPPSNVYTVGLGLIKEFKEWNCAGTLVNHYTIVRQPTANSIFGIIL